MNDENFLMSKLDRLHTTEMGAVRVKRNLGLETDDVVGWCREKITSPGAVMSCGGKNWYVEADGCVITINARCLTIITAHRGTLPPKGPERILK